MQRVFDKEKTGDVLTSQAASHQVFSALKGLTTVFEMGTGVTPTILSPDYSFKIYCYTFKTKQCFKDF